MIHFISEAPYHVIHAVMCACSFVYWPGLNRAIEQPCLLLSVGKISFNESQ